MVQAAVLSEMTGLLPCSFCLFQQASPPQIQIKTARPKGRESTWLSPVLCEELLRAGAQHQEQLGWFSPDPGADQPFDLHPIPAAKVTPDLQSHYFPNVCGSSDSPPSASCGWKQSHRAQLSLVC